MGRAHLGKDMAALVERRTTQFWAVLERAVPNLEEVVAAVLSLLAQVDSPSPEQVVHGDICPGNILVDGAGRPTARMRPSTPPLPRVFSTCTGPGQVNTIVP